MSALSREAIEHALAACPAWHHRGNAIERVFDCKNFDGSMSFVNAVAAAANAADHHPDIQISWNRVSLTLTSHDTGGLTERDFALAQTIDALAPAGA